MGKPKSFSDQLRQAVHDCGVSTYALAKQLGIAPSTLSRFLSGERGLTLGLLDRLADLLGLRVVTTVQHVQRPAPRGRKKKGGKQARPPAYKTDWQQLAAMLAKDAHENYFESRRGIWHLEDADVLCVYSNNPYAAHPELRDQETAKFRRLLRKAGIKELAYATYPRPGKPNAGYTYAMLLDGSQGRVRFVNEVLNQVVHESIDRLL